MRLARTIAASLSALAAVATSAGLVVAGGGTANAATPPVPAHVFAPYFEAYSADNPATIAQESGAKYLTFAFLQTPSKGSCTVDWNGAASTPVAQSTYGSEIATIRAAGGDAIPSFGGYAADHGGTEIADSCTNVASIAAAYESVITTYDVTRLDMDVEDKSETNSAGIDRRNKAIAMVQAWAAANNRTVTFSYTLPTTAAGLDSTGLKVLQNAISNKARIDIANIMTFDYYDGAKHEMGTDSETAATDLEGQLANLYPGKSAAQLWAMVGVTEMIGIDDFGAGETFTTADAAPVETWAASKGIGLLSYWAIERDNGGCVGTKGKDTCSGVQQSTWLFTNAFEKFNGGGTQPPPPGNDFSLTPAKTSGSVKAGNSLKTTVATAITAGKTESVALTASGAPAGVTVTFKPASVASGASATLTVATTSTAVAGKYAITVTGTAASGSHSVTYNLTVRKGS
ncbi:MAG TPA: chitinase [Pseudonocardiaceae bacterium]|jgi:hypothetical protein|nr:chitinase [Pseudonocardiaceae bacterium]